MGTVGMVPRPACVRKSLVGNIAAIGDKWKEGNAWLGNGSIRKMDNKAGRYQPRN